MQKIKIKKLCINILILFGLSFFLTCISFHYTTCPIDSEMIKTYFEPVLFILNLLPIVVILSLFLFIFKKMHIAFLVTSILVMILGVINQTKILYRDDIFKFEDLLLAKEALSIANTQGYDVIIGWHTILSIILILSVFIILKTYVKKYEFNLKTQVISLVLVVIVLAVSYTQILTNEKIYNSVGDTSNINVWIGTRQYQIRGLVYPFIYTLEDGFVKKPNNYSEEESKDILNEYDYEYIPEDKKVNVIAIMLEAYNDFTKFNKFNFTEDIYEAFHKIEENSISGKLVTSVFGGGTIETERAFLTGYNTFPSFRKNTNSYVWYFKEQGYRTEAMHPIYGAFYNRTSCNPNLGFDTYYNYENRYSAMQSWFLNDTQFFNDIINKYNESKRDGIPYFNFSVTYQNHGPYRSHNYEDKNFYFENTGYDEESYNIINEYFDGIKRTNEALNGLIEYFDNEEEPVIIVLFGDHNPYLGENGYQEFGIDLDLKTVDGFKNYYETPYIIHANNTAKEMFNKSFVGKGNDVSPMFLMNELFEYCGLKGNEFLQYTSSLKSRIDVINPYYYKENGEYILVTYLKNKRLIEEYENVNYYYSNNYSLRSVNK